MIKKLIINADDFGMCEGNSLGILLAHEKGLVSSTTVMMNMPYALWALDKAKAYPNLGIGVHLNLTAGKPLLPGKKSYTDEEGNFLRPSAYEDEFPDGEPDEVYEEWKAQIEAFIAHTGHLPTHLDSHHGSLTVVSIFSLTKSLKTLIISMLLSFFIVKFVNLKVGICRII